jgi:negative regulator of sigma-B (phosphoserine phosphatase)
VSSVTDAVHRCHEKLRTTRGVVLTLAMIQPSEKSLVWLSVGNVDGLVLRSDREAQRPSESVLHSPGVVGYQLPVMRPATHDLLPGDLLVMATDGIDADFRRSIIRSDPPRLIAARLLRVHRTGTDDALVLVSRIRDAVEDEVEDEVSSP